LLEQNQLKYQVTFSRGASTLSRVLAEPVQSGSCSSVNCPNEKETCGYFQWATQPSCGEELYMLSFYDYFSQKN
jgi:hypothetical protein